MRRMPAGLAVACTLALALTAGWGAPAAAGHDGGRGNGFGHFKDVQSDYWAYRDITMMEVKGVFGGYGNGEFGPQDSVTRIQLVCLALRLRGLADEAEKIGAEEAAAELAGVFTDAASVPTWEGARECLAYAYENGFLYGLTYGEPGQFRPNDPATRLDVVVTLIIAAGLDAQAAELASATIDAPDAETVPEWAIGYVALAREMSLLRGDQTGRLNLFQHVTRAEMAALLGRVDEEIESEADHQVIEGELVEVTAGTSPSVTIRAEADELADYDEDEPDDEDEDELGDEDEDELGDEDEGLPNEEDEEEADDEDEADGEETLVTVTYPIDPSVTVFVQDRPATLADLTPGCRVVLRLVAGSVVVIDARGQAEEEERGVISGVVTSTEYVGDVLSSITVAVGQGEENDEDEEEDEVDEDDGQNGDLDDGDQDGSPPETATEVTFPVSPEVKIRGAHQPQGPEIGDFVRLKVINGEVVMIILPEDESEDEDEEEEGQDGEEGLLKGEIEGVFISTDGSDVAFTVTDIDAEGDLTAIEIGKEATLPLAEDASFRAGKKTLSLDDLDLYAGYAIKLKVEGGEVVSIRFEEPEDKEESEDEED